MSKIGRFCVFCGKKPREKNKEHVIPKWLIALTGDPNRNINIGLLFGTTETKELSFDSFCFPACRDCNNKFSNLENNAKPIILAMLKGEALSEIDCDILLDWIDKIRVGLWLGYYYLNNKPIFDEPHFFIDNAIGAKDRILYIIKSDNDKQGVGFIGCNTPLFLQLPTCFSLIINNLCFFNISANFLISRRFGFPFPKTVVMENQYGIIRATIRNGLGRAYHPLMKKHINMHGSELYQVCHQRLNVELDSEDESAYNAEYVKENTLNQEKCKSIIRLCHTNERAIRYPSSKSHKWIPKTIYEFNMIYNMLPVKVYEMQIYLATHHEEFIPYDKDALAIMRKALSLSIASNKIYLKGAQKRLLGRL